MATVPPGTGMMLMANDQVEFFENKVENNKSTGLLIVSYLINQKPIKDEQYDPYCEAIYVHDNKFVGNGEAPAGDLASILGKILGTPFPDIMYDGIRDEKKFVDGDLPGIATSADSQQWRCRLREFRRRVVQPGGRPARTRSPTSCAIWRLTKANCRRCRP